MLNCQLTKGMATTSIYRKASDGRRWKHGRKLQLHLTRPAQGFLQCHTSCTIVVPKRNAIIEMKQCHRHSTL
eukprot:1155076-Pelagomonas_calceolata.AAC.5